MQRKSLALWPPAWLGRSVTGTGESGWNEMILKIEGIVLKRCKSLRKFGSAVTK